MYGSSKMVDNLKVRPNSDSNISAAINPLPSSNHFHLSSVCLSCPFLSLPCGKIEKFSLKLEFFTIGPYFECFHCVNLTFWQRLSAMHLAKAKKVLDYLWALLQLFQSTKTKRGKTEVLVIKLQFVVAHICTARSRLTPLLNLLFLFLRALFQLKIRHQSFHKKQKAIKHTGTPVLEKSKNQKSF